MADTTTTTTNTTIVSRPVEILSLMFYASLLLVSLSTIAATFTNHPLFPLNSTSLAWSNAWLLATVINYYSASLCLCGVIVSSEETWLSAILWIIACCGLGGPACCLYVFLWLTKEGGTLRLERDTRLDDSEQQPTTIPSSKTSTTTNVTTDSTELRKPRIYALPTTTTDQQHQQQHHRQQQQKQRQQYHSQQQPQKQQQQQQYYPQHFRRHSGHHRHHHHHQDVERGTIS